MATATKTAAKTADARETTDVEDARLLADAIMLVIQQSAYDDMTWAEIDAALRLTSHEVKVNWTQTGTVKPAPPPAP